MPKQSTFLADRSGKPIIAVGENTRLPVYSLAKTIIAFLVDSQQIDLNAEVSAWVGQDLLPHDKIKIYQLLQHTSGLMDYGRLPSYQQAIKSGNVWQDKDFIDHTLHQPLLFPSGKQFAYSNPGYWLLKEILQRATNRSFTELVDELATRLTLPNTQVVEGQFAPDLPWYPSTWVWHGLIVSTAHDMVEFLNAAGTTLAENPRSAMAVEAAQLPWKHPHYGIGLMIEPGEMYGHNGGGPGYTAACYHFIKTGVTGCVLINDESDDAALHKLLKLHSEADANG